MTTRTKHVLITGGSRGIGLAIARLFARNSYRCTLLSRNPDSLKKALSTLPSKHLSPAEPQHASITGDVSSLSFWTASEFGSHLPARTTIDVLVNCAGISQARGFGTMESEEIEKIVGTNLTGMMMGTRFLRRGGYMRGTASRNSEREGAVVINISSLLGLKGGKGAVAYAASKAGVLGFTRALAQELAPTGIRVNAIVPGYITSDMTAAMADSESLLSQIPARRFGKPEEVADAALFLVRNQYAINCVINLDGGLSAV